MSRWTVIALSASLPLAILAQWTLCCRRQMAWVGLVIYVVALLLSLPGLRRRRRPSVCQRARQFAWRPLLVLAALVLMGWAAYATHISAFPSYRLAALLWLAGLGLGLVALLARLGQPGATLGRPWREAAFVGIVFVVALALRLVSLARYPDVMSGDEGSFAMEAQRIAAGDLLNPFGTGWFSNVTWFFYLQAASLRVFGHNLFGLRFPSALLGALSIPAIYLLARGTFGREVARVCALFLAGWSFPLHFSRLGISNGADPFFAALMLAFLQRGMLHGRRIHFAAAGLALGIGLYFYVGLRLMLFIILAALMLSGIGRLRRRWRGLLIFAVVCLLVAGPLAVFFVRQPHYLAARHAVVGLFQSGQLAKEQQFTGKPVWRLLIEHLGPAASVFVYTHDGGYFYRASIPMLYVLSGAFFVLGFWVALWRWWEVRHQVLLLWVGLTVVLAGWLLKAPPHYDRYLGAAPAVCLLVGRGAVAALRRLARAWGWRPAARRRLGVLVGVALLLLNAGYYLGVYIPAGGFNWDHNTVIADRTARLMAELGPGYTTYFFGTSLMRLGGFNSVRFLAPQARWMDVEESPPQDWSFVRKGPGALFVVLPEREEELQLLRERFPDGHEWRDEQGLFTCFRVDVVEGEGP